MRKNRPQLNVEIMTRWECGGVEIIDNKSLWRRMQAKKISSTKKSVNCDHLTNEV